MADKSKIVENSKGKLLNIFTEEKDKEQISLPCPIFSRFLWGKLRWKWESLPHGRCFAILKAFFGEIAATIKGGFDKKWECL